MTERSTVKPMWIEITQQSEKCLSTTCIHTHTHARTRAHTHTHIHKRERERERDRQTDRHTDKMDSEKGLKGGKGSEGRERGRKERGRKERGRKKRGQKGLERQKGQ
jgi:hypothetical protein